MNQEAPAKIRRFSRSYFIGAGLSWGLQGFFWPKAWSELNSGTQHSILARVLITVGVVVVGLFAYLLSRGERFKHGVAEVGFAIFVIWQSLSFADPKAAGIAITGAIYVIVRGLRNIVDGRDMLLAEEDADATSKK